MFRVQEPEKSFFTTDVCFNENRLGCNTSVFLWCCYVLVDVAEFRWLELCVTFFKSLGAHIAAQHFNRYWLTSHCTMVN